MQPGLGVGEETRKAGLCSHTLLAGQEWRAKGCGRERRRGGRGKERVRKTRERGRHFSYPLEQFDSPRCVPLFSPASRGWATNPTFLFPKAAMHEVKM